MCILNTHTLKKKKTFYPSLNKIVKKKKKSNETLTPVTTHARRVRLPSVQEKLYFWMWAFERRLDARRVGAEQISDRRRRLLRGRLLRGRLLAGAGLFDRRTTDGIIVVLSVVYQACPR